MKAVLGYLLSEKGQKEAAKKGLQNSMLQTIEIDIVDANKIEHLRVSESGEGYLGFGCNFFRSQGEWKYGSYDYKTFDDIQTVESLFVFLQQEENKKKKKAAEIKQKEEEERKKEQLRKENALSLFKEKGESLRSFKWYANNYIEFFNQGDRVKLFLSDYPEIKEYNDRKLKEADRKLKEAKDEKIRKEKEEEEGRRKLFEWANLNGSELLKARIEENLNWVSLAQNEYLESYIPEGFEYIADCYEEEWRNANLSTIKEIREIRKDFKNNPVFVSINAVIYKFDLKDDEQYYDEEENETVTEETKYALELILKCVDGFEKSFTKFLD